MADETTRPKFVQLDDGHYVNFDEIAEINFCVNGSYNCVNGSYTEVRFVGQDKGKIYPNADVEALRFLVMKHKEEMHK